MTRPCTVCNHPDRVAIDKEILNGTSYRIIANQNGLSFSAVQRHKEHIPESLTLAHGAEKVSQADDLLHEVKGLQARAIGILNKAEKAGDLPTALKAIREAKGCLELLAKLHERREAHELTGKDGGPVDITDVRKLLLEKLMNLRLEESVNMCD